MLEASIVLRAVGWLGAVSEDFIYLFVVTENFFFFFFGKYSVIVHISGACFFPLVDA